MNTTKKADCKPKNEIKNGTNPCLDNIPKHWEVQRLGTSVKSENNGVWGDDPDGTNDIVCIRVADFDRSSNRIRTDKLTLRSVKPSERSGRLLRKGDLLLEKSGGGEQQPVGALVMYNHDFEAVCSNFVARLVVREGYDPTYLTYLHRTLYATGVNKRSIKQTTGIQNIDSSSYLSERVGIPPIKEQAAIVRYLDNADQQIQAYIDAKQRRIALLEEYRQAIIHQAVTHGLDPNVRLQPSGVEWLGDIPEHWERCRLRNVVSIVTTGSRGWSSYASDTGPLFIRITNLSRGSLKLRFDDTMRLKLPNTSEIERTRIKPGDLLISVTAYIGAIGIAPETFEEGYVSQHVARCQPLQGISSKWLGYVLLSKIGETHGQISLYGGAKDGLSLDDVKNYQIILPPKAEQTTIVEHIEKDSTEIDTAINSTRRQIELMEEYRMRLIADVVTGKLDVRKAAADLPDLEPTEITD